MKDPGRPPAAPPVAAFRPLYRQVKDILLRRLSDGTWTAGQALPSEPEIATDLGVSPGTVRKALEEMTAESLVVRRQGRGTFVASHDDARVLFQFFRLLPDDGAPQLPASRILSARRDKADADAARWLALQTGDPVVRLERIRSLGDAPVIHETIVVPAFRFPHLETRENVPGNLYSLYASDYGVTIAHARENLKAVIAGEIERTHLGATEGEAILFIERIALAVDGAAVEWRRSLCRTNTHHYRSDVR
jgi:GntR family transcriptional regulator